MFSSRSATGLSDRDASDDRRSRSPRRGVIVIFAAILMLAMMAMLAFAIDTGYMYALQSQLHRAVDAAALAGAGRLVDGMDEANLAVEEYMVRNPVGGTAAVDEEKLALAIAEFRANHGQNLEVSTGNWNATTGQMEPTERLPSTISVSMTYPNRPLFFAPLLGRKSFDVTAHATAMFQPRDIALVLDFSGSMNDDSTFAAIDRLGRESVEANLLEIYQDLGSPVYGSLAFTPTWMTVPGAAQNDSKKIPHVTVQYRNTSVYVTSTKTINKVRLQFSNGSTQTFTGSSLTGTFQGTGSYSGREIDKVWVNSWVNTDDFGSYGELFDFSSNSDLRTAAKKAFGLNSVAWPYPAGSWDNYIDYCISSNGQNNSAGYRYKFGYMSLCNYWLDQRDSYAETPDLWKVRAYPLHALKQATDVFMDYIREIETHDRVALIIYDSANGEAILEHALTSDLDTVAETVYHRQAGHYHSNTNIGAGMKLGREHLDAHARPGAVKMIVLMTDGLANWHNGRSDVNGARRMIEEETALAAERKYPIFTLSLGTGADTSTMAEVAEGTKGESFIAPGGATLDSYREQLQEAFRKIANARPLKLVE